MAKLTETERERVEKIRGAKVIVSGTTGDQYSKPSVVYAATHLMTVIDFLLSLIDRLAQEPDVVRCGECRRYDDDPKRGGCIPGEIGVCRGGGYRAKPDDFCSYGERKEGQHGTD